MQVELVAFKVNFIGAVPLARLILPGTGQVEELQSYGIRND